ncbi:MAG: hypothetical protein ACYTEX_28250 [Planctomycetota bacterium]
MARRYYAQRLRQAALAAQTDPEAALAAYPGPMIGAEPGAPLSESNRPAVRAATAHRTAEKERTAMPQFYLRAKRMGLPPAGARYTEDLARDRPSREDVLSQVIDPQYAASMRVAKAEQAKGRAMEAQGRAEEMRAQPLNALLSAIGAGIASGDSGLDLAKLPALIRSTLNLLPSQPAGDSAMPVGMPNLLPGAPATADADAQMGYDAVTLSDGDRNKADQLLRTQGKTPEESKKILNVVMPPEQSEPWFGAETSPEQFFGERYEGTLPSMGGFARDLLGEIGRQASGVVGPEEDLLGEISRVLRAPGSPLAFLGLAPDPYEPVSTIPTPDEMGGKMVLTDKALDQLVEKAKTDPEMWDLLDRIARGVGYDPRIGGNARAQEALIMRVGARPK